MAEVTALLFLCMGILAFTRKLKPFKVLSSIVLYFSFIAVKENVPLQFFYVVIILIALIPLIYIKTSREKKDVFFFSIPCWLYIVSVLVSVNVKTQVKTQINPQRASCYGSFNTHSEHYCTGDGASLR